MNHLAVFLALLSTSLDFDRVRSKISDEIKYLPTLYPGDSVFNLRMSGKK
jgi:cytochrome P450 family 710 subfamily A protein